MTNKHTRPQPLPGPWYEQDPANLAAYAKFRNQRTEEHLLQLQQTLAGLNGDGWVRSRHELRAHATQREALQSDIIQCERRLLKGQDFADAFTRISLRGGKPSEIDDEILRMKQEGILRRHPVDVATEQLLQQEDGIAPTDDWFREYNPKYQG